MINYAIVAGENKQTKKKHILNCTYIPDHPFRIIMIRGSGPEKTNALHKMIKHKDDDD